MPLVIYGKGNLGRLAQDYLKVVGREVAAVIERNEDADKESCVAVSVVTAPYVPIERLLLWRGYKMVVPFYDLAESYRDIHPLSNGWFAKHFTGNDKQQISCVLAGWADDVSRAHHLQFMAWHKAREEWSFLDAPTSNHGRFFIPEITKVLHNHETFVDVGAHHGDVSSAFIDNVRNTYTSIEAIEPDATNRAVLEQTLPRDKRIKVHDFAISDKVGVNLFHSGLGYASQISCTGHNYVLTYNLDTLDLKPTFLKLHIEGAELEALRGAKHTLMKQRPIVVSTVYHNDDGLWRTPQWLMNWLSDYKFLFRAHTWCGTGAVMYAIPKERFV